jgi:hypothetical protein
MTKQVGLWLVVVFGWLVVVFGHVLAYIVMGIVAVSMGADLHHWMLSWHPWLTLFVVSVWGIAGGFYLLTRKEERR